MSDLLHTGGTPAPSRVPFGWRTIVSLGLLALLVVCSIGTTSVRALALAQPKGGLCGPPRCYAPECAGVTPRTKVDYLILLDVSVSMDPSILAVKNVLRTWLNLLTETDVDAHVAIVTYSGRGPVMDKKFTPLNDYTLEEFEQVISMISTYGGHEGTLETIRGVFQANRRDHNVNTIWRADAHPVLMLFTDEDSDPPVSLDNLVSGQPTGRFFCPPESNVNLGRNAMTPANFEKFQQEVDLTADILIRRGVTVFMAVPSKFDDENTCLTSAQFGEANLNVENGDLSGYDPHATHKRVRADPLARNSIQGQMLDAGSTIRLFQIEKVVQDVYAHNFVKNMFIQVTDVVTKCDDRCMEYTCTKDACLPPKDVCGCDGVRHSGKVFDCKGVCGGPAKVDCNGTCNGPFRFDQCGVCTLDGATSSWCEKDCSGNFFRSGLPKNVNMQNDICPAWFDPISSLVADSKFREDARALATKARADNLEPFACEAFRTKHEWNISLKACQPDVAAYRAANPTAGLTSDSDKAGFRAHYLATGWKAGLAVKCLAGSEHFVQPPRKNQCGQCTTVDGGAFCKKDCSGAWRTSQAAMHFVDDCGQCLPAGTNPNKNKDDCGICWGENKQKNACGECNGPRGLNPCGVPLCRLEQAAFCQKSPDQCTCAQDCAGQWYTGTSPANVRDACGQCHPASSPPDNCLTDCKGARYRRGDTPANVLNECGQCLPRSSSNTCVKDCAGKWYDSAKAQSENFVDQCGKCTSRKNPARCEQDCRKEWVREGEDFYVQDVCGICVKQRIDPATGRDVTDLNQNLDACRMCPGVTYQKDPCGNCPNSPKYKMGKNGCGVNLCTLDTCTSNCQCLTDCKGNKYQQGEEPAFSLDQCGFCTAGGQTHTDCQRDCKNQYYRQDTEEPANLTDPCGNCMPGYAPSPGKWAARVHEKCQKDCAGAYFMEGKTAPENEVDACGTCHRVAPGPGGQGPPPAPACVWDSCREVYTSDPKSVVARDECGVCGGTNADKNECGKCNGVRGKDPCGQLLCSLEDRNTCPPGSDKCQCLVDCAGDHYLAPAGARHRLDECGLCFDARPAGGAAGSAAPERHARCKRDCAGIWFAAEKADANPNTPESGAQHWVDPCGKCMPAQPKQEYSCQKDCAGTWGGAAFVDKCGRCRLSDSEEPWCVQDCAGAHHLSNTKPKSERDDCGVCRLVGSAEWNADLDPCGLCRITPGYNSEESCTADCSGKYLLVTDARRAAVDFCGECHQAADLSNFNRNSDRCGICHSSPDDPKFNAQLVMAEGRECGCLSSPEEDPYEAGLLVRCHDLYTDTSFEACHQCPETNACDVTKDGTVRERDRCGRCPGDVVLAGVDQYELFDECGMCCNSLGDESPAAAAASGLVAASTGTYVCNQDLSPCGTGECFKLETLDSCGFCVPTDWDGKWEESEACLPDCSGRFGGDMVLTDCGQCIPAADVEANREICMQDCGGNWFLADQQNPPMVVDSCDQCVRPEDACSNLGTGAIVGIAVGAVAAAGLVAAGAVFAVKYAAKNGLLASSKQAADLGGTDNNNPLFTSRTTTADNPLFAAPTS
ncbi:hypothetical protein H696_03181 [Fonticula alba]|uniref:VWFA domain-containing protein n=1 Tax=Fonticula alba TaxID=691883 RepID=A0A058Z933_FONAL|nr:hypothetical protein H696_03181 [Fonticula alba]KCV70824.1 hypothetical protein H696_03181 [Fonticula alba]|eukprot:XP_009495340.1 hypothetical protein H696_03181 [Fonticula alba]